MVGQQAAWWILVSSEKSIDAANCREGSNISGLCPRPPPPFMPLWHPPSSMFTLCPVSSALFGLCGRTSFRCIGMCTFVNAWAGLYAPGC